MEKTRGNIRKNSGIIVFDSPQKQLDAGLAV
jgi:hypothetical protein